MKSDAGPLYVTLALLFMLPVLAAVSVIYEQNITKDCLIEASKQLTINQAKDLCE